MISPNHWHCPDYPEDLFAEADAHQPCPPYDHRAEGVFSEWCDRFLGLLYRACAIGIYVGLALFFLWLVTGRTL